jgi:hypothetical protein
MRIAAPWMILALALPLAANGLDTLRTQLQKPAGPEALKASVECTTWNKRGDDKKPVISQGKASAWVEEGPQGLKIFWSRDLLQQVGKEVRAHHDDPEKTTPTQEAMGRMDALTLLDYFDAAPALLRHLDQAQLLEERPDTFEGKAVKLMTFKLAPKMSAEQKKYVKEFESTAKVWVDGEGVPVAAEVHTKLKGRALLVINFSADVQRDFRFARINGRLVTVRFSENNINSGAGENSQEKKVATLTFS